MVLPALLRASLCSVLLVLCPACSVVNTDHCGNQDGNATCLQRDPAAPYCSICVADNNGCLAAAPPTACVAETAPATTADASTTAASTADSSTTTGSSTGVVPTTDPATSSSDTTAPVTGSTTTTSETSASSTGTSEPGTTTADTSTGAPGTSTTTGGPVCGNNMVEGDEVCDGTDFNGETCKTVVPGKWGGGSLGCNECMSLNDSKCCVGLAGSCGKLAPNAALPCCGGLTCKVDGLNGYKCASQ